MRSITILRLSNANLQGQLLCLMIFGI